MKGGARARSGPAPDPNALRRDRDGGQWVTLPAEGRQGPAPNWPLPGKQRAAEKRLWEREWQRPQAVMWEAHGQELEVAIYVRTLVEASVPKAPAAVRTLLRQQQEALGISQPGLARNRWRIGEAEREQEPASAPKPRARSGRSRFKVVTGGGGGG